MDENAATSLSVSAAVDTLSNSCQFSTNLFIYVAAPIPDQEKVLPTGQRH